MGEHLARLLGGAHLGRLNGVGAHIAGPRDDVVIAHRRRDDDPHARRLIVTQHALQPLIAEPAMLHIDDGELRAGRFEDLPLAGGIKLNHEDAELEAPVRDHLTHGGGRHPPPSS